MTSMLANLRSERGLVLPMALGVLAVLTIASVSAIAYSTSNFTASNSSKATSSAYDLAESGINDAISIIAGQLDDTGAVQPGKTDPRSPSLLPQTTVDHPELHGSVTYSGTIDSGYVWTITSTGTVRNGGTTRHRTLTRQVAVKGINAGADTLSWSRFYQDDANSCLTIDHVAMPASVATRGSLCLVDGGTITGSATTVDAGGDIQITGPATTSPTRYPATASGTSWSSPTRVGGNDSSYATYSFSGSGTSNTLVASNFGLSVPSSAVILGISVTIERKSSSWNSLADSTVYLQKNGTQTGWNRASNRYWSTSDDAQDYGADDDLWGTTWTAADVNSSGFGVRLQVRNWSGSSRVGYVDYIRVTVSYSDDTDGIGTSGQNVQSVTVGGNCVYNANPAHNPCSSADQVYADTITNLDAGSNPDLSMPEVDFGYWFLNGKPGPQHPCTNSPTQMGSLVFDNDGSGYSNASVHYNDSDDDMTPPDHDYTCQVVENGVRVGELSWNHTTHVLTIDGTIFFDGDVRFDGDGQIVHYQGRAIIYAAGDVEFDEQVCAGGSGTTGCIDDMSNWDPQSNMMVILSNGDSEYDQGGDHCWPSGTTTCPNGHSVTGFQGVVSARGSCLIHENFHLSGPVVCNKIQLPYERDGWPTYYPFPSLGDLVDGQKYRDTATATHFELDPGQQTG
jgi:hypothetical protein